MAAKQSDYDCLAMLQRQSKDKIRELEIEMKHKADKLRGYNDMKRRYEVILTQLETTKQENRKIINEKLGIKIKMK